jgi:uncharacterized protein (DUF1330 family)
MSLQMARFHPTSGKDPINHPPGRSTSMSILIIGNITVDNPAHLKAYQELAGPSMNEFGIRLVGKAGPAPVLEGAATGSVTVVLEADSEQQARAWHGSESYAKAIAARSEGSNFNIVLVPRVN